MDIFIYLLKPLLFCCRAEKYSQNICWFWWNLDFEFQHRISRNFLTAYISLGFFGCNEFLCHLLAHFPFF